MSNSKKLGQTLSDVAQQTFEQMAFMLTTPEEERVAVSVTFTGPFSGRLFLSVPNRLLPMLAANMLGAEDEDSSTGEQRHDSLKELANVICGNLLPVIDSPEAVFDVGAPELTAEGNLPTDLNGQAPAAAARLAFDEGQTELVLYLDK